MEKLVVVYHNGSEWEGAEYTVPVYYESIEAFFVHHEEKCRAACKIYDYELDHKHKEKRCAGQFILGGIEFEVKNYMWYNDRAKELEYSNVEVYTLEDWFSKHVKFQLL